MNKRTGILIVFLGVDGAGKSTTLENVKSEFDQKPELKYSEVYLGPWGNIESPLIKLAYKLGLFPAKESWGHLISKKIKNSQSVKYSYVQLINKWLRNLIKGSLYYFSVYFELIYRYMKYVRPKLKKGYLILADRFVYDLRYIYKKREIKDFPNLRRWLIKLYPKPDLVIYLWNDAHKIVARKAQLKENEINLFQGFYNNILEDEVSANSTQVIKIKTDKAPSIVAEQSIRSILNLHSNKIMR